MWPRNSPLARRAIWTALALIILAGIAAGVIWYIHWRSHRIIVLQGAIVVKDSDARKQTPISGVQVTAIDSLQIETVKSDSSGLFLIPLHEGTKRGQAITLEFRHPDYFLLDVQEFVGDKLYIIAMVPRNTTPATPGHPPINLANVTVRYSVKSTTDVNIGSAVKTFEVANKGNVPCRNQHPCSPDGKWKAGIGSTSLDAGTGNVFRDARVSCIAGPCPFTKIESERSSKEGQVISVSARNWSDTTTFLLEAEVLHTMPTYVSHEFYPVIFGKQLSFTLPAAVEGVTIEADVDQQRIFFPLGPAILLSWANCSATVNPDRTRVFRCELKPGYRFK
ncbi:MAG TPA: hypothetical protein VJQ59_06420 [Candidatus Sulfotelmatobacter sp.]|nr:hypothetical protein [Candidatus Sulfotelmatobacter sp.]